MRGCPCVAALVLIATVLLHSHLAIAYTTIEIPLDDKYIMDLGAVDLDGDGVDELVVITHIDGWDKTGQLLVYSWGSGGFHLAYISEQITGFVMGLEIADLDGDGREDVLVACDGLHYFRNTPEGLQLFGEIISDRIFKGFAVTDLDGDGRLDIAAGYGTGDSTVRLYRNTGTGLSHVRDLPGTTGRNSVVVSNVNGDALPDLVAADADSGDIHVYRNLGGFNFSTTFEHTAGHRIWTIVATDFDNDGLDDFAYAGETEDQIHFFENRGAEGFHEVSVTSGDPHRYNFIVRDLDRNGRQDLLATAGDGGELFLFSNQGSFAFTRLTAPVASHYSSSRPTTGDFDGDGHQDVAFGFDPVMVVFDASSLFGITRHTHWTEIASHAGGLGGSQWRTDLVVLNMSASAASVQITLHTSSGDHRLTRTVAGREQAVFEDIVGLMGVNGMGSLEIESFSDVLVLSRIYNQSTDGSFGQLIDGHVQGDCLVIGEGELLLGLRQQEGRFRTNISVTNTSSVQAVVMVILFSADGVELLNYQLTVDAKQVVQDPEPFKRRAGQPNLGWGYAVVGVIQGADVLASASVIDSRTNDATTITTKR